MYTRAKLWETKLSYLMQLSSISSNHGDKSLLRSEDVVHG